MVEVPIDVLEMLDYFKKDDQRTVVEVLRLEKSNSIHNLCVVKVVNDIFYVTGECLSGHDVCKVHTFNLNLAANCHHWKLECSWPMPAGKSGSCKHIMAGVRVVERYVISGNNKFRHFLIAFLSQSTVFGLGCPVEKPGGQSSSNCGNVLLY
jgi:hypothetical protein